MDLKPLVEALKQNRLLCPFCGSDSVIPNEAAGLQAIDPNELRYAAGCLSEGREFEIVYRPDSPEDQLEIECPHCGTPCEYYDLPNASFSIMKPVAEITATVAFCYECEKELHEKYRVSGVDDHGVRR